MTEHSPDLSLGGDDNTPQRSGDSLLQFRLEQAAARLRTIGWSPRVGPALVVLGMEQRLFGLGEGFPPEGWTISTGLAGFGNEADSGRTPTGLHRICACIGDGAPSGMVFKSREPTGEIVTTTAQPGMDCITTRILWLEGMEEGINRGPGVDSRSRYIYIHGTPDVHRLGQPVSAGCVRMNNDDIITLFALVSDQTPVLILP
ncbi:MAG: L,D-transpeptidase [Magnetococcales bacterium]|nr:L,D-transpeptidase [Magnetococcales bacterium]MBF0151877.1 L,D-transpeptidase [Magnetococcales bacterium]MBF0172519.1 L,D-transpeptidase [Magnetococcales bacterium]MBF0347045.1 L,D-transpeptidase [Magnetococcales bacterium]MBF0632919.1 L,D-transpeptidase [Magnetococcales bacterium]